MITTDLEFPVEGDAMTEGGDRLKVVLDMLRQRKCVVLLGPDMHGTPGPTPVGWRDIARAIVGVLVEKTPELSTSAGKLFDGKMFFISLGNDS